MGGADHGVAFGRAVGIEQNDAGAIGELLMQMRRNAGRQCDAHLVCLSSSHGVRDSSIGTMAPSTYVTVAPEPTSAGQKLETEKRFSTTCVPPVNRA